ncbi:PadR family transcriptional regulator [Oceanivirga salmonicida]|nr:PadR family transcriptional regulator [Oceanivirga salmonicida]
MQITSDILEFCVLSCLKKEDLYGYALTQNIQEKIQISESTLYPVLRRLKQNDLLSTYDNNYQGRNRRYYKITKKGLLEFEKIKLEWTDLKNTIDNFLKEG